MYLKSIEVQGFKSFAHKIKFDFHNGITGIVGPNGSGKSNVVDAVRWVFGEQSAKQLRSSSMQDVIFAGTQLRKALGFASVTLVLDNSDHELDIDYDTVSVTRKLYRSGESEYLLNDAVCRLKDVQELFYDTGIGKEGYSIIGQVQIDKILSGKPEDRRELFDEAAGIVKFKKRKQSALKRLEEERANMIRLTDILKELERQTGPLEKQSENAKTFLKLRDELKTYDINAFLIDRRDMDEQYDKAEKALKIVSDDLSQRQQEDLSLKSDYASVEERLSDLDRDIDVLREDLAGKSSDRNTIEGKINVLREQIHTEEVREEHIRERLSDIADSIRRHEEEISGNASARDRNARSRENTLKTLSEKQTDLDQLKLKIDLYRQTIEAQHGAMIDMLNEKSESTAKLQHFKTLIEQNALRITEEEERIAEAVTKEAELASGAEAMLSELRSAQDDLEDKQKELSDLQTELTEAEDSRSDLQRKFNDLQQAYQVSRSKADTLRNMAERYEGYGSAVKKIMDVRSRYKGIEGVVADLIHVEPAYQTAVETALGGSIQNVVTDTDETAKALVSYLKENQFGRATFLPINTITPRGGFSDPQVLKEKGVIGTCDTLVTADSKYEKIVRYLLGHFVVADTIDSALRVSKKYRHAFRIVTLTGELLSVGGSITGGAFKNQSNLLGRAAEIEALDEKILAMKTESDAISKKLNRYKQLKESLSTEIEAVQEDIYAVQLSLAKLKAAIDGKEREKAMTALERKEAESRLSELRETVEKAEREQDTIRKTVEEIESKSTESSDSGDRIQSLLQETSDAYDHLQPEIEELTLAVRSTEQNDGYLDDSDLRLKNEIEKLKEERASLENRGEAAETISVYQREIETLKESMTSSDEAMRLAEDKLAGLNREKDALLKDQHAFFEKRDSLNEQIAALSREQIRLESQKERIEEKLDSETEYLWNEYQLTPSEAEMFKVADIGTGPTVRRHVGDLKKQIADLGHVNVNAIEEYKEVSERYGFLKSQYDDIVEAEKTMVSIVSELDEGMRKTFNEKFAAIRSEFDKVFRELFGGGHGTLTLYADQDVIDSDIAIIAEPPGKKLVNMMQLSNGEKALTAICLLFAIQNLKPSPFCLLDEIEAALDDSNVGRFTGYLRKLEKNTQFIVITHRRGTMVAADRLYGITMQEKGVSTLVSVNLVEQDLDN